MNGLLAATIVVVLAAIGGAGYGLQAYGGALLPETVRRNIPLDDTANPKTTKVSMWVPGVIGHMVFGAMTGFVFFGIYVAPTLAVGSGVNATWYHFAGAMLAGLGGSKVVNDLVDKKQWSKLPPKVKQDEPAGENVRALDALKRNGTPVP